MLILCTALVFEISLKFFLDSCPYEGEYDVCRTKKNGGAHDKCKPAFGVNGLTLLVLRLVCEEASRSLEDLLVGQKVAYSYIQRGAHGRTTQALHSRIANLLPKCTSVSAS